MWTSIELASEHRHYRGNVWRIVEAQHRISTNRLAASNEDQSILEDLADEVKPRMPAAAEHLHFLLSSPFRYGHGRPSRFRSADVLPGIFYSAETEATAIAEAAYWRLRFFSRSPGFTPPSTTSEHTSFSAAVATNHALDLTEKPFAQFEMKWTDPSDYTACQELAAIAREAGTQLIRSLSARATIRGHNIIVLDPGAFAERSPKPGRTWHFRFQEGKLVAIAAFPSNDQHSFNAKDFGLA